MLTQAILNLNSAMNNIIGTSLWNKRKGHLAFSIINLQFCDDYLTGSLTCSPGYFKLVINIMPQHTFYSEYVSVNCSTISMIKTFQVMSSNTRNCTIKVRTEWTRIVSTTGFTSDCIYGIYPSFVNKQWSWGITLLYIR